MQTATKKTENLSIITEALESAHALIQEKTGAPRATILVTRKTGNTMGHFTHAKPWISGEDSFHEIMISAEYFPRGARAILGTLLHETAHSLDLQAGIQGVTGDGYHNKKFKATAEALGLTITQAKRIGWSNTEVSDECAERWGEALALGARAILGTLLHETAHSLDLQAGIQGVTGDGYHNKKFKATAEALGLTITQAKRIGWSNTEVSDECAERWGEALALIEAALALTADTEQAAGKKGRDKNNLVAICACEAKIRLSKKVFELCAPKCQNCEQEFEIQE